MGMNMEGNFQKDSFQNASIVGEGNGNRIDVESGLNDILNRSMPIPPRLPPPSDQEGDDEVFYTNNIKVPNDPTPLKIQARSDVPENVSVANEEVVLRHPEDGGGDISTINPSHTSTLNSRHSHSTSDLLKYRKQNDVANAKSSKNDRSMILEIPRRPIPRHLSDRSRYLSSTNSFDGINMTDKSHNQRSLNTISLNQDLFAPYVSEPQYTNGSFVRSDGDFEHNKDGRFSAITHSTLEHLSPTSAQDKKRFFIDVLSTTLSILYAVLTITLGVSFYVVDYLELESPQIQYLAEGYSLTLLSIALLYLLYLTIDVSIYMHKKAKYEKLMEDVTPEAIEMKETMEGQFQCDVTLHKALTLRKELDHRYCFNKDRHSSNFYLKIGAAVFCFGHLIHSFVILTYRGIILNSSDEAYSDCIGVTTFVIEILYPVYSILLLFFIFKYSNVIINKNEVLHRFGFMHCLAASLCFWVWTIFRETAEYMKYQKDKDYGGNDTTESEFESRSAVETGLFMIAPRRFTKICEHDELNVLYQNYSPYLYPFSVEYSILVVGILYIVWINIGLCSTKIINDHGDQSEDTRECQNPYKPMEPESNVTIHADCHAANRGLFGGFIVMVFCLVSVILFFITYYNETEVDLAEHGRIINRSTQITIMTLMIIAAIFAYIQMVKLDVNASAHNFLDNFLLVICIPAFLVHGIFSIIPAIIFGNVLAVIGITFEISQIIIQTPFMIDGMARSSNTKELRKRKPGRELVTFLIICNIAMWIMQTFEVKSHGLDQYRQEYYSKELWSIVGHMCLPLMMFYRFHSSACIVDIWKYAYVPAGH